MSRYIEGRRGGETPGSGDSLGAVRDIGVLQLRLCSVHRRGGGRWRSETDGDPYFSWLGEARSEVGDNGNYLMVGLNEDERGEGRVVYVGLYKNQLGDSGGGEAALAAGYNIDKGEFVPGIALGAGNASLGYVPALTEQERFKRLLAIVLPRMKYGGVDESLRLNIPPSVDVEQRFNKFVADLRRTFCGGEPGQNQGPRQLPTPNDMGGGHR